MPTQKQKKHLNWNWATRWWKDEGKRERKWVKQCRQLQSDCSATPPNQPCWHRRAVCEQSFYCCSTTCIACSKCSLLCSCRNRGFTVPMTVVFFAQHLHVRKNWNWTTLCNLKLPVLNIRILNIRTWNYPLRQYKFPAHFQTVCTLSVLSFLPPSTLPHVGLPLLPIQCRLMMKPNFQQPCSILTHTKRSKKTLTQSLELSHRLQRSFPQRNGFH